MEYNFKKGKKTGQLALFTVLYLGENEVECILLWRKLYMKTKLKKILLALIFVALLPIGNIFAQSRAISANGVTVPTWMQNCIILNSEYTFGRRTIGQVLSIPQEKTKLNKVTVTDTKVSLDYALTKDDGSTIWTLYVEFTCVKSGNGGNCYISMLKFEEPLSFKKETVTCSSPYEYNHGVCLGMLYECSQYMFIDEVRFNEQKAYEENIKNVEENLLNDFVSRTSSTYIDDELLDLGKIKADSFEKDYMFRLYAVANRASVKKGLTPCYYQKIGDAAPVYDTSKWKFLDRIYQKNEIYLDESATGFIIRGNWKDDLTLARKDFEHKAQIEAKRKVQRDKEDEEFITKVLAMEPSSWYTNGKIRYSSTFEERFYFHFSRGGYTGDGNSYKNYSNDITDYARIYAILNKASEKASFSPCYYQMQGGKKIFNPEKWQLGNWNQEVKYGTWEKTDTIEQDSSCNGFYYNGEDGQVYRKDSEAVEQKIAEIKAQKAKLKAQRDKEDEETIAKILEMKIRDYSAPDTLWYDSGSILYNDYYGRGLWFNAEGYGNDGRKLKDVARLYAIMNKASEKAGFSPCYYQEQNGEQIFDSEKWQLGEWKGASVGWEKGGTIKQQKDKNGFYYTEIRYADICRNDPKAVAELEEKKRAEEEAKKAEELAKRAKYKADREKKDAEDAIKIAEMKFEYWSNSGKIKYGRYHFNFSSSEYYSISGIDPRYDDTRISAIMNKASEEAGFRPCYYQEQDGEKVFDSNKWQLGKWEYYYGWAQKKTIKKDNDSNGFYYESQGDIYGDIYRYDPEYVAQKRAEEEAQKAKELAEKEAQKAREQAAKAEREAKLKAIRDNEDEEIIAKILEMKIRNYSMPDSLYYDSGSIMYNDYYGQGLWFNAAGYGSDGPKLKDATRLYAIMNKASEKAGFSPCYYQEQDGAKIFDSDKWQLGEWKGASIGWEKGRTIKQQKDKNGFYCTEISIYRNDPVVVAELEEKKRAEEEAKKAEELAKKARYKAQRDKEDEEFITKVLSMKMDKWYESGELQYEKYKFQFNLSGYERPGCNVIDDNPRIYSIMNKASTKSGFAPCYYQEQDGEKVFDSEKWQLGEWEYNGGWERRRSIKRDESKNGFYFDTSHYGSGGWGNICRKDLEVVAELLEKKRAEEEALNAKLKAQRDEEDIELIEEILSREPSNWSDSGEIRYGHEFRFNSKGYTKSNGAKIEDAVRMYSILNKASVKLGYSPCYYQIQDGNKIYDSDKWDLGEWKAGESWNTSDWNRYSWEKADTIKCDESANGFRREKSYDGYHNGLVYRIDSKAVEEHKAKLKAEEEAKKAEREAMLKARRDAEDEKYIASILAMEPEKYYKSGEVQYGTFNNRFDATNYSCRLSSVTADTVRIYAILNKASEKAGFKPCYYQVLDEEKIFDSEKWQLGEWNYDIWEKTKTIKQENTSNGFYYYNSYVLRNDFELVMQKVRQNEEIQIAIELCSMVSKYRHGRFEYEKIPENFPFDSEICVFAIMNRASTLAELSPCYYQMQNGTQVFDTDKWIFEYDKDTGTYTNGNSIQETKKGNGFRFDKKKRMIIRNKK